jgi:hypothetical protein
VIFQNSNFWGVTLLELFAHPIVTIVHFQYQATSRRAITFKEGSEPG